jgi:hypothetical protein
MTEQKRFTRKEEINEPKVLLWIKAMAIAWYGGDENAAWETILKEEATKTPVIIEPKDNRSHLHLSIKQK